MLKTGKYVRKSNTIRTKVSTQRDKSGGTGERRKTKKTPRQGQTVQTKLDIPKQQKKFLSAGMGRMGEDIPITECKGSKEILEQNIGTERS